MDADSDELSTHRLCINSDFTDFLFQGQYLCFKPHVSKLKLPDLIDIIVLLPFQLLQTARRQLGAIWCQLERIRQKCPHLLVSQSLHINNCSNLQREF